MKTIVITGATGFIGVHLLQQLYTDDCEIYAVVRTGSPNRARLTAFPKVKTVCCDMEALPQLRNLLPEHIDVFYHLAWEGTRRPQRDDEALQRKNYLEAIQAYEIAREKGCRKFIGAGSQAEYGKTVGLVSESYPARPHTMYGKYKLQAGLDLLQKGKQDGVTVIWPRIFSAYGRYDNPQTMIMTALEKFQHNEPMKLTECTQNWNYLYVKDVGRMLALLGLRDCEPGVYNFASCDNRPLREYVLELKKLLHSESVPEFGAVPYGSEGVVSFQPDISRFRRAFPFFRFTVFASGIREMVQCNNTQHKDG